MLLTYSIILTLMKRSNTQYLQNQRKQNYSAHQTAKMLENIPLNTPHTLLNQTLFHSRGCGLRLCEAVQIIHTIHHYPHTWTILQRTKSCSYMSIHNKYTTHKTIIFQHFQFRCNDYAS
jgi:hypothetical protein